jgi:hypothetical protein
VSQKLTSLVEPHLARKLMKEGNRWHRRVPMRKKRDGVDLVNNDIKSVPLKVEKFQPHTKVRMHCSLVCPPDDLYAVDCDFPRQPIGASCKPRDIVASANKSSSNT